MSVSSQVGEPIGVARSLEKTHARGLHRVAAESSDAGRPNSAAIEAAFRAGDAAAAEVVAEHLAPIVSRLVRRLSAWSGEADDLVQDVLVTALATRVRFRGQAKLETWITRIAINHCRAQARKQWIRRRLFGAWARKRPPQTSEHAGEDNAIEHERAAAVRAAVARLPTKGREAIVLCYLEEMTPAEAAEALGVRRGTVEVRLTRARQQLRELLAGEFEQTSFTEPSTDVAK